MSITFRNLGSEPIPADASALGIWYARVADIPIEQLQVDDLCRALRQELFLEHVVPLAVEQIKVDANAGGIFDGELVSALARIERQFWERNRELAVVVVDAVVAALPYVDEDVRRDASAFLETAQRPALTHP